MALRAYLRELDGDRKGAQADYEKAIAVCPLRARTRFLLANFWNREGRPEKEIPMLIEGARLAKSAHLTGPPDPKAPKLEFARALAEASVGKPKSPPKPPRVADLLGPKGNQYLFLDWAEYPE